MKKRQNSKVVPVMALFGTVALLGACAPNSTSTQVATKCTNSPANVCIDIAFDSQGCPKSANPNGDNQPFYVENSKRVIWQSVDNTPAANPIKAGYEIFFDPFKGQPHKSNGIGRVSAVFDPKAPSTPAAGPGIEYKYSIVGDSCKDKPHDPRFLVRR
jgi:hypothetical protein